MPKLKYPHLTTEQQTRILSLWQDAGRGPSGIAIVMKLPIGQVEAYLLSLGLKRNRAEAYAAYKNKKTADEHKEKK